jgi:hypothetical protein
MERGSGEGEIETRADINGEDIGLFGINSST